jgi:hypothetical protein
MLKLRLMKGSLASMLIGVLLLTACGGSNEPEPTPTLSVEEIQAQAVGTFSAALTQTALAAPTDTPTSTPTPEPTIELLPTSTSGIPFGGATSAPPASSCYSLRFVSDVTIPDNTQMTAGQTFTKTWKVLNAGTCAWDAGFKFSLTGGEAMGSSTLTLATSVPAGAQFDLSVPMVAPATTGTHRGNWRMSTAGGQFFGDEVYVIIVVGGTSATSTSAPAIATPTVTTEPTIATP